SAYTPVAISRSTARTTSTVTAFLSMIEIARSARPCVFDSSGDRLSVQLMNNARRSEKSHRLLSASTSSFAVSAMLQPLLLSVGFLRGHDAADVFGAEKVE